MSWIDRFCPTPFACARSSIEVRSQGHSLEVINGGYISIQFWYVPSVESISSTFVFPSTSEEILRLRLRSISRLPTLAWVPIVHVVVAGIS